jgi:uroporphyrinogen-III synthase
LLTVGDVTAERGRAVGFGQVFSGGGDATDLAALAVARLRPESGTLLLAVGQFQGHALADDLRAAGFRVLRRAVYATTLARRLAPAALAALRTGGIRAALFFSAETARHFVHLAQRARVTEPLRVVDAVSIGRSAAVALEVLPWRRISVAARPNQDEMLALLR